MVQLIVDRLDYPLDVCEVHDPTRVIIHGSSDVNVYTKRVPVESTAFVFLRHVRQAVRRFYRKRLEDLHRLLLLGNAEDLVGLKT